MFDLEVGHVGPPMGQVAIRLVDVPDMNYFSGKREEYTDAKPKAAFDAGKNKSGGEVWIGGYGVSPGYYDPSVNGLIPGLPSNGMAKKTKEDFFKEDGFSWFKTGDIGSWTERGTLKIVDRRKNMFKTSLGEYVPVEEVEKVYQDSCPMADFVFLPKETKVAYVALCVVVSESIGTVMKWAKDNGVEGDEAAVCKSKQLQKKLFELFGAAAKDKKLAGFMKPPKPENIHVQFEPLGYQEQWVEGVTCANGHKEQLLTATFKARRSQLDQYFAPIFPSLYPDRPKDHILP
jgi:long-chain acyl-CoA synthetase